MTNLIKKKQECAPGTHEENDVHVPIEVHIMIFTFIINTNVYAWYADVVHIFTVPYAQHDLRASYII